ncbi:hypothetical protein [Streptomyces griseofuscus]|uniref:Uncharacterized protein n=1 Tax=Streptomyces griseofuscus TaxID=146922 RepID=A0A7H1Q3K3_9ACTN|nr:hypothetical protein [Streptomyces griseofuscus]QNT94883.1 hypothetical protein HEP81_04610 [Streptomyces griseofuscus]
MLTNLDVLILTILGGLFINPRRYRSCWTAVLAALATGIATGAVYMLVTRVLLPWLGVTP